MKAIIRQLMRFPEIGSRIDQNDLRIDPRIDLRMTLPDWSPDGPQIPDIRTSEYQWSRIGYI